MWWWYFAAVIYVLIFWSLCSERRPLAMGLIFALAPFQQDISLGGGVKFSVAEANILLATPMVAILGLRIVKAPTYAPAAIYIVICILSSILNWREAAFLSILQTALYLVVVVAVFSALPRTEEDCRPSLIGLVIVGSALALVAVKLRSFDVLGLNKNGLGASLSAALLVGTELWLGATTRRAKRWYAIGIATIALGLVMSLSRGAWLGASIGLALIFLSRGQVRVLLRMVMLLVPAITVMWLLLPQEKRVYATDLRASSYNVKLRFDSIDLALSEFKKSPLLGVGTGFRKEYDATNLALCTLAETGVLGLAAFLILHMVLVWHLRRALRQFPRNTLSFSLVVIAIALVGSKFVHGMVDHYWSRGSLTNAWAASGMAFFAIVAGKKRGREQDRLPAPISVVAGIARPQAVTGPGI